MKNLQKIQGEYQQKFGSPLESRLNPDGVIGSTLDTVPIRPYAGSGFQERISAGILNTGLAVARYSGTSDEAIRFFERVKDYVQNTLPEITADDRKLAAERQGLLVSDSLQSFLYAPNLIKRVLQPRGFFESLERVYTALEILCAFGVKRASTFYEADDDLREGRIDAVNTMLEQKIGKSKAQIIGKMKEDERYKSMGNDEVYRCAIEQWTQVPPDIKFSIGWIVQELKRNQLFLQHIDEAYATALRLLGGIKPKHLLQS